MVATTVPARRSTGQIVLLVSGVLLLVAFFLPWVNTGLGNPSGLGLATTASALQPLGIDNVGAATLLYLVPVLAVIALALAFVRNPTSGLAGAGAGLLAFVVLIVFLV